MSEDLAGGEVSWWLETLCDHTHPQEKDKLQCDNYRGISLLCHSQKLMASVLLGRIKSRTEEVRSEAQAGFRPGRSTIDQLFTLRLLAEKYYEFGKDLYICYVDFQKAFDSVWRKGLWQVMIHLGYDIKIIRLLQSMYHNTTSSVRGRFPGRAIKLVRDTRWGFTRLRPLASTV